MEGKLSISEIQSTVYRCPSCDASILKINRSEFKPVQGEYYTIDGDALQAIYHRLSPEQETFRNFEAGLTWGHCKVCASGYFSIDVNITAVPQTETWWNTCLANDREYLAPNYLVRSDLKVPVLGDQWVVFSEKFQGVRFETHVFRLLSEFDDEEAADSIFELLPSFTKLSQSLLKAELENERSKGVETIQQGM